MFCYLIPDPQQRSQALAWFASRAIVYALQYDLIYTTPEVQGLGSRLLQPILQQAREAGQPCYLVTFTEQAVRFYQKNGFEVLRRQSLTDTAPSFWTLKRDP